MIAPQMISPPPDDHLLKLANGGIQFMPGNLRLPFISLLFGFHHAPILRQ
jgi:hypothetical protein